MPERFVAGYFASEEAARRARELLAPTTRDGEDIFLVPEREGVGLPVSLLVGLLGGVVGFGGRIFLAANPEAAVELVLGAESARVLAVATTKARAPFWERMLAEVGAAAVRQG
jgi:tetrahydromethanopterin S-methyltransferase subunit D